MSIITAELPRSGIWHGLHVQKRIIGALILRDMKTRFGRSLVGYLIAIAWPLSHMLLIMSGQFVAASRSRVYVLGVATVCLFLGISGEKLFRGRFYQR